LRIFFSLSRCIALHKNKKKVFFVLSFLLVYFVFVSHKR